MLTVTDRARRLVRSVVPAGDGLRITARPDGELRLDVARRAAPRDQVIALPRTDRLDAAAPRLFLEEQTALLLDDAVLDAADGSDGPSFVLRRRTASAA